MPKLQVRCITYNVGDQGPPVDELKQLLGLDLDVLPDIISIGLQEVVSDAQWRDTLTGYLKEFNYILLKSRNCWAIWMYLFVKRTLIKSITNIESESTASGFANIMGNKGAASVRFEICGINIIFVSGHLAAHDENADKRISDFYDIITSQSFRDEDVNTIHDHDYIFFMGDLNFRLDNISRDEACRAIERGQISKLLECDQLKNLRSQNLIFKDFKEGPINFPPTFKFDNHTDNYDTSKKQRTPAWTDRILYFNHTDYAVDNYLNRIKTNQPIPKSRRSPFRGSPSDNKSPEYVIKPKQFPSVELVEYTSLPMYKYSDHRPVVGSFIVDTPPRWFDLPIRFIHSVGAKTLKHDYRRDLEFSYVNFDPPMLIYFDQPNKKLLEIRKNSQILSLMRSTFGDKSSTTSSSGGEASSPTEPIAHSIDIGSRDWIGVYRADFTDLQADYVTYTYATSPSKRGVTAMLGDRTAIKGQKFYQNKISYKYLKPLLGESIILVYFNAKKNCPQGYSGVIEIAGPKSRYSK